MSGCFANMGLIVTVVLRRGLEVVDEAAGEGIRGQDSTYEQLRKKAKRENAALIWEQLNKKGVPKAGVGRNFAVASLCREVKGKTDPDKVVLGFYAGMQLFINMLWFFCVVTEPYSWLQFWKSCLGVKTLASDSRKVANYGARALEQIMAF